MREVLGAINDQGHTLDVKSSAQQTKMKASVQRIESFIHILRITRKNRCQCYKIAQTTYQWFTNCRPSSSRTLDSGRKQKDN
jgi:hypothetical protein